MNILRNLVLKDLKLNKKRTIGTIIGIVLSCALITVIGLFFTTLKNTLLVSEINSSGYWHLRLNDLDKNEISDLSNNRKFSKVIGVNVIGDTFYGTDGYMSGDVYSMDKETFEDLSYKIIEGEFPKNSNEILINNAYAYQMDLNVGDTFDMEIGEISTYDSEEEPGVYYTKNKIVNSKTYKMKVSGIISRYGDLITTGIDSDNYNAYLVLKNPNNHIEVISNILGVENYKNNIYSPKYGDNYNVNEGVLRWEVFDFSDQVLTFLTSVIGIVIAIIMITSIFSIRNSFAISISEKLKTYGMLSSVGATKKQIRKMVLFEGFILGIVGIVLGVFLGIFVTYLLTYVINMIATNANLFNDGMKLYYKFSIIPCIIAVITSIIVIYLSVITCAIKASRVSPIQNIRNSDDVKSKKIKMPKFIRKIFGIGGVLSYKNLKRSKKKYRVTVISLTVSILIFITTSSLVEYGLRVVNQEYLVLDYNLVVYVNSEIDTNKNEKLTNLKGAHVYYSNSMTNYLLEPSHVLDKSYTFDNFTPYNFVLYDDNTFKEYVESIGENYEEMKDKFIIINDFYERENNSKKIYKDITDYKKGDYLVFNGENDSINLEVGAVTTKRTYGLEDYYGFVVTIVGNYDYYKYKDVSETNLRHVFFNSEDPYQLEKDIHEISDDYYIENITELVQQMKSIVLIVSIIVYGFIIVVTSIGITSVFNTINSNMELRSKDFATLKSIGMTKKEFNNMINLEAIFYSLKSLFFGLILGIVGSLIVYKIFINSYDYSYMLPIKSIIIAIIFIVVVVLIIMRYSIKKINKQNIIETIRNSNI